MKFANRITERTICILILVAVFIGSLFSLGNNITKDNAETKPTTDLTEISNQQSTTNPGTTAGTTKVTSTAETTENKPVPTEPTRTQPTSEHSTTTCPPHKDLPQSTCKLVCFTFDDGPYAPVTNKILDTLEKYNGKATFFVVGDRAKTYAKQIKRAYDMGCEIGTHTYSHANLTKLTVPEMQRELRKSCAVISSITGEEVKILRPPEGATNDKVKANVGMPMVLWSVDSLDWSYRNAEKDYNSVMENVFDGSIVLMHDLYPATAEAVARLIPKLADEGYKFVTFSELMEIRGIEVKPGEKYFSAKPKIPSVSAEGN